MRKCTYATLEATTQLLAKRAKQLDSRILKSNNPATYQAYKDEEQGVSDCSQVVYQQFLDLRGDYIAGHINQAVYRQYLIILKNLLLESGIKLDNKNLRASEIAEEIKRYMSE